MNERCCESWAAKSEKMERCTCVVSLRSPTDGKCWLFKLVTVDIIHFRFFMISI